MRTPTSQDGQGKFVAELTEERLRYTTTQGISAGGETHTYHGGSGIQPSNQSHMLLGEAEQCEGKQGKNTTSDRLPTCT